MLEDVEWGEFRIGDLFESSNGDFDIQKSHINNKGVYVITSGLTNNGILGQTDIEAKIFEKNTITVDMFGFAFYRPFEYKMVTHARVFSLKPKIKITDSQGLFLTNSFSFLNQKFSYQNMCSWNKIKNFKIKLPIKDRKINFSFMEKFIAELEGSHLAELEGSHLAELEAYLTVSNLKNYKLTEAEEKVLKDFENGKVEWGEFRIDYFFDVCSYKKRFDANKIEISGKGKPYITRTAFNNGLRGYINEEDKYLNDGNTISFGQDTATMFYQEKPYFTGDKIKILKPKDKNFKKENALFFINSMSKSFKSFSWGGSSFNENIIKKQICNIPIKNEKPNYEIMETFISAIQKLVIKDVVLYSDKKIKATKEVVEG